MRRSLVFAATVLLTMTPLMAGAQGGLVPQKHVPAPVLDQLRAVEHLFESALARDCASERCTAKGCFYRDHAVVDLPRARSLPGFDETEGPGSVPVQEYLTHAQCEFVHEKTVTARDLQALTKRLEQTLSRGWLKVSVTRQALDPLSPSLTAGPAADAAKEPAEAAAAAAPAEPAQAPPTQPSAARELWSALLPHFAWMIALLLGTAAVMAIIWALRRLGRETIEEKAMLAQLTGGAATPEGPLVPGEGQAAAVSRAPEDAAFVATQQGLWRDRIADAELGKDHTVIVELLRQWLKQGEFPLLAKAIVVFGDRLSLAFPADGDLAVRKVEFAEYLRQLDERTLPSDTDFFRKLNHHAVSSALLSQTDAAVYHSLRDEFGSAGIAALMARLPPRFGALLFALSPSDFQQDLARSLPTAQRVQVAGQLLLSNRMSREEQTYLFSALAAARMGQDLPPPPPEAISDRGREVDAAGALSLLLEEIPADQRQALFAAARARWQGSLPLWYQNIVHPTLLLKLPAELQAEVLLDVDVKNLGGWLAAQSQGARQAVLEALPASLGNAVRANMSFTSRAELLQVARRGREDVAAALQRAAAGGRLSFDALWA